MFCIDLHPDRHTSSQREEMYRKIKTQLYAGYEVLKEKSLFNIVYPNTGIYAYERYLFCTLEGITLLDTDLPLCSEKRYTGSYFLQHKKRLTSHIISEVRHEQRKFIKMCLNPTAVRAYKATTLPFYMLPKVVLGTSMRSLVYSSNAEVILIGREQPYLITQYENKHRRLVNYANKED